MIKIFHAPGSRSVRIIWLLEELGLDYELEVLKRGEVNEAFVKASPFSKLPTIIDGEVVMSESVAIVQYILQKYGEGRLEPDHESIQYAEYLQWLNFGESVLIDPIVSILINKVFRPEEHRHEYSIQSAEKSFAKMIKTLNSIMEGRTYIMGDDFTAADIINGYTLRLADNLQLLPGEPGTENVVNYFKSLVSRDAYKKAISDTKS
tara:strand:- start:2560 stop:3177 length:618 start_codon:yes stop_codon:yes gene_type:complete